MIPPTGDENYTVPPQAGVKLSKKDAGYVAAGPFSCAHCRWYEGGKLPIGRCAPIGRDIVNRDGCCDVWNVADAKPNQGKIQNEYVYVQGATNVCAECSYFDPATFTCWPVDGLISPKASCNKWTPLS